MTERRDEGMDQFLPVHLVKFAVELVLVEILRSLLVLQIDGELDGLHADTRIGVLERLVDDPLHLVSLAGHALCQQL